MMSQTTDKLLALHVTCCKHYNALAAIPVSLKKKVMQQKLKHE